MTPAHERDIRTQEDQLTRATRELDLAALDRLYADDVMFTGVTGVICDKAGLMDEARRGAADRQKTAAAAPIVTSFDKDELRVVALADAAVTSYRFIITIRHEGTPTRHGYRTTNVWMKRGAGWQVAAGHTSSLGVLAD